MSPDRGTSPAAPLQEKEVTATRNGLNGEKQEAEPQEENEEENEGDEEVDELAEDLQNSSVATTPPGES